MGQAQSYQPIIAVSQTLPWSFRLTRLVLLALAVSLSLWGGVVATRLVLTPTLSATIGETVQAGDLAFAVNGFEWLSMDHGDHTNESSADVTLQPVTGDVNLQAVTDDEAAAAAAALGFSMPPAMMPGLPPEGQQRLRVEVSLQNTGGGRETIGPEQFRVETADGAKYPPLSNSTFRTQTLVAGQGIGVVLFIDVEEDAQAPQLVWARGGKQVTFQLLGASGHGHE